MKSFYPRPGTRKSLCRSLNRLLLVLLLSVLSLPAANIRGAEVSDQTYEFVLNDVVYTCSGLDQYNQMWVSAAPVSADAKFVSVQLYFPDLQKYIPEIENITQKNTTVLSGDIWKKCENLKSIELITVYDNKYSHTTSESSTNISILKDCPNLKHLFVTGNWAYWILTDVPVGKYWLYHTEGKTLFKEKYNTFQNTIQTSLISDILKNLVYETTLEQSSYTIEDSGLTPVVELQAVRRDVPLTSEWHPMPFDSTGKPAINLIGDLNYRVSAKELHGLKNPWKEMGVHHYGETLFKECFDNFFRGTERFLCSKTRVLSAYVMGIARVTNDNDNEMIPEPGSDKKYRLPFGNYHIEIKSAGIPMCYKFKAESKSTAEVKLASSEWTPNSLKMKFRSITGDQFEKDAVLGLCETEYNETTGEYEPAKNFVPFDYSVAQLYSEDNQFSIYKHTYPKTKYNPERHTWCWSPIFRACICVKIGNTVYKIQDCAFDTDESSRENNIYFDGDQIVLRFYNLFNVLPAGNNSKAGVISDGTRYSTENPDKESAYLTMLRPETTYPVQVYYQMNGKEYISNTINLKTLEIPVKVTSLKTEIQSASIVYGASEYSSRNGKMKYRDVKLVTDQSKTYYPTTKGSKFIFSELPPAAEGIIYCQPYYISKAGWEMKIGKKLETKTTLATPQWISGTSEALTTKRARLRYSTNISNIDNTYVEWRRVDAPAIIQSTKAMCPVVDGNLVGILNNLTPDVYYQFRPAYEYGTKKYYGEWVGIFTGDANVWFDPEITTSPALVSQDGNITLRGSVLPGSGDVTEQGFEIWPLTDAAVTNACNADPAAETTHRFIPCNGISMAVEVSDLLEGTTYAYRAYAKVETKSYTGSEQTFTTPGTQGIGEITIDDSAIEIVGYYNLQGVRSDRPMPGLNIVVYSNGKTEKRIFRDN